MVVPKMAASPPRYSFRALLGEKASMIAKLSRAIYIVKDSGEAEG
jgi:hypothetical protein